VAVAVAVAAADSVFGRGLPTDAGGYRQAAKRFRTQCLASFDHNLRQQIESDCRTEGLDRGVITPGEYASTLLAVVSAPPWLVYVSVGDCFLVVDRRPGGPFLLSPAEEVREHAGGTVFMTSDAREEHCSTGIVRDEGIGAIALSTDGLYEAMLVIRKASDGTLWFEAPADFSRYFDHFRSPDVGPSDMEALLSSAAFADSSGDDKTMIMLVQD